MIDEAAGPAVSLRLMTPAEYGAWSTRSIQSYAEDLARSGHRPIDAAFAQAQAQFSELLPDGVATKHAWLFTIVDPAGSDVGNLWMGVHPEKPTAGYVYDIEIDTINRGKGLGRSAMLAAERVLIDAGYTEIGLNVFGFNQPAARLYESIGYRTVSTQMLKSLQSVDAHGTPDVLALGQPDPTESYREA